MKKAFLGVLFVLGGVFLSFSSVEAATTVNTNVTTPTTWTPAGSPYVITGNISTTSNLTITSGTVVKLGTAGTLNVSAVGSLNATGVVFTSILDDGHGGSTRPPGNTQPLNILNGFGSISSAGSLSIDDSQFFYGGRANRGAVEVIGGTATVTDTIFRYHNNGFIQSNGVATLRGNTFEDIDQYAVWQKQGSFTFGNNSFARIVSESYLITKDTFTNEGGNTGERNINLQNMVFTVDKTLNADGLPYQFNATKINSGVTLALGEGSVVKFWNTLNNIDNSGTLRTLGTKAAPVTLTSYYDDTAGGDSNGDGVTTRGGAGQWTRIYNNGSGVIDFAHTTLRHGGSGGLSETGLIINYGTVNATRSTFSDSLTRLINAKGGSINIERSELARAEEVLMSNGLAQVAIHRSALLETSGIRIINSAGIEVDASNNYWGNASGPVVNGNVFTDPTITTNVNFSPYLSEHPICETDCFSNVLFLPGIMGSRLYDYTPAGEEELWVSSSDSKQERMEMNDDGTSKNTVYTKNDTQRGIEIDETGIVDDAYSQNLYESFIEDLRDWKSEGVFTDYAFIPYDWRLSLEDVVMNGKIDGPNLSYTTENTDLTQSYLYQQLRDLQATSKSEKVTLIGHSNGGLVIKAFVQKLKDENDPLYHQIDKVILVAVPQTGTPDAVVSMLYGSKLGIAWLGVSAERSRSLVHNMSTMYNLLPSEKMFDAINPPIEFVGNNIDPAWTSRYGDKINTYQEFQDFLLGVEGRDRPDYLDTSQPEVLRSTLLSQAETVHQTLDNWSPSAETEVIQIAGWGLYTVAGLEIINNRECIFNPLELIGAKPVCSEIKEGIVLSDKKNLNGDYTVLTQSALSIENNGNTKNYWVDLGKYNDDQLTALTSKFHKSILEVSTLRLLIKSTVQNNFQDIEDDYVTISEPSQSSKAFVSYEIHSPLHLTVTDSVGNKIGWDSTTDTIVENIKGAQYFEIGEIKTVLIPKDTEHTVKLTAYAEGSFTLDIEELQGEQVLSETKFEAIPTLAESVVEIVPATPTTPAQMSIDFDADGTVETEIEVAPGETTEYENPVIVGEDEVAPEIALTFDQTTRDIEWTATDDQDENPSIVVTATQAVATDASGNTTTIPFIKYREGNTRLKVKFEKIIYNEEVVNIPKTMILYDWKLKREELADLDTTIQIKEKTRFKAEYRKNKNVTKIIEKNKELDTETVVIKQGFVSVNVETKTGEVKWNY